MESTAAAAAAAVSSSKPACKKAYSCTQCDASFVRPDSLRSHIRCHQAAAAAAAASLAPATAASLATTVAVSVGPTLPVQAATGTTAVARAAAYTVANSMLAFVQNNQNAAIEDNIRNMAISGGQVAPLDIVYQALQPQQPMVHQPIQLQQVRAQDGSLRNTRSTLIHAAAYIKT